MVPEQSCESSQAYIATSTATRQCLLNGSILRLPRRLVDMHLDRQRLARAAVARAAQGAGPEVVEPDGDPHMGIGGTEPVRRIERHPAELGHEGLGPGWARMLLAHPVVAAKIAADIARRDAQAARGGDEDVAEILADPALEREGV